MKPALPVLLALTVLGSTGAAYTNSQYGFTVPAPMGFKQVSYPGTAVVFAGPAANGFATNINVVVERLPAGVTLAQYLVVSQSNLRKVITEFNLLEHQATQVGGVPAVEQRFTGHQGTFDLYFSQTVAISGGQAYALTGTSRQDQRGTLNAVMSKFIHGFTFHR